MLLRLVPVGVAWRSRAIGSSLVRTRFFIAQLAGVLTIAGVSVAALTEPYLRGFAAFGLTLLVSSFLPGHDEWGRQAAGAQLIAIPGDAGRGFRGLEP